MRRFVGRMVVACSLMACASSAVGTAGAQAAPYPPGYPFVPVDTQATAGGAPGILVAGDVQPADAGVTDPRIQLVAVDRTSGAVTLQQTFGGPAFADDLESAVAALPTTSLVLASSQPGWGSWVGAEAALAGIGVAAVPAPGAVTGGGFSAIGVVGSTPGQATQRVSSAGPADITGALTIDPEGQYAFITTSYVSYGFGSDGTALDVEGTTYPTAAPAAEAVGGFRLWLLDSQTLAPLAGNASLWETNQPGDVPASLAAIAGMVSAIEGAPTGSLVFVTAFGQPYLLDTWAELTLLSAALADAGGTLHVANTVGGQGGLYALAGWTGAGQAGGRETSSVITGASTAYPTGVLSPDSQSEYRPRVSDPSGLATFDLDEIVFRTPAVPFPAWSGAGQDAAYAWASSRVQGGVAGDDLRTAYWESPAISWTGVQSDLTSSVTAFPGSPGSCYTPPSGGACFDAADLQAVRDQLLTETTWVGDVQTYFFAELGAPYSATGLQSWADYVTIAQEISESIDPSDDSEVAWIAADILAGALEIGWAVSTDGTSMVLGTLGSALEMGMDIAADSTGTSGQDAYQTTVAQYGQTLSDEYASAVEGLKQLFSIVVVDYGKLQAAGTSLGCLPTNPGCAPQWAWSTQIQDEVSTTLVTAMNRQAYSDLLPAKYQAAWLPAGTVGPVQSVLCTGGGGLIWTPFRDEPALGAVALTLSTDPAAQPQLIAMASAPDSLDPGVPDASILEAPFTSAAAQGLGIYAPTYFVGALTENQYACSQGYGGGPGAAPPQPPQPTPAAPDGPPTTPEPPAAATSTPPTTRPEAATPRVTVGPRRISARAGRAVRVRLRASSGGTLVVRVRRHGRLIATERRRVRAGRQTFTWDGRVDRTGRRAGPGRYVISLELRAGGRVSRDRVTLVIRR